MNASGITSEGFERVKQIVTAALDGIDDSKLEARPDPEANSIAWLIWHLTRVQDDHVADAAGQQQVWITSGWYEKFGLPFEKGANGFGDSSDDVAKVKGVPADLLLGYFRETHRATQSYINTLSESDFDTIVDENWDPPVTLGVRLMSVISDDLQHAGQAAFIRGVLERS